VSRRIDLPVQACLGTGCCASHDARIADALESRFTGIAESQPELLARHCTEAGLVQKAAALWGKAGLEAHALWVEFWSGNYVTAGRLVEQGVVLADEKRAMHWKTLGMIGCGCLFSVTGDASNALQMLTSGIAAYRSTGATVWMPMILSHLARTYAALDKLDAPGTGNDRGAVARG
jgi:hypothetical protein